jgi:hypothetical protein
MLKRTLLMIVFGSVLGAWTSAAAAEFATPEEAKAMLGRAIAEAKTDELSAIKRFNNNDLAFRDRDLFVFCFNSEDGKFTAHEALVARDVRSLRDSNGKSFGMEMYNKAQEDRITEVVFASPLPGSTETTIKKAYVTRVGDQVCGVSAYQLKGTGPTQ